MDFDVTCLVISSHSLWRPVKFGTTEGRAAFDKNGFVSLREKNDIKGKRKTRGKVNKYVALSVVEVRNNGLSKEIKIAIQA